MKKTFIAIIAATVSALALDAEILTPQQALARVKADSGMACMVRTHNLDLQATGDDCITYRDSQGRPALYLLADGDGRNMTLVTADSEAEPLVGYFDEMKPGAEPAPGFSAMVDFYTAEIEALRDNRPWATTAMSGYGTASAGADFATIAPICRTTWNQDAPYNNLCPEMDGKRCMTGCVATAMAQVMKSYAYPAKGRGGVKSYVWKDGGATLNMNMSLTEFDWDQMLDSYAGEYTAEEAEAVATLMKAVGYGAEMNYSPTSSGALGRTLATALVSYFSYDCTLSYVLRPWYTNSQWEQMIYDEIAKGRPVYYDGANGDRSVGHAFVIDGYSSDHFFHVNWGWGGMSNGYFRLSALDPYSQGIGGSTSGYNFDQGAIIGMAANRSTSHSKRDLNFYMPASDRFTYATPSVALGGTATFACGVYNAGPIVAVEGSIAVKFTDEEGNAVYALSNATFSNLPVGQGYNPITIVVPPMLADGMYTVSPAVYDSARKMYFDVHTRTGGYGYCLAMVAEKRIDFFESSLATINVSDIQLRSRMYPGMLFDLTATVSNPSDEVYNGTLRAVLYNNDGTPLQSFDRVYVEVSPGDSETIDYRGSINPAVKPGSYLIAFIDESNNVTGAPMAVTVESEPTAGKLRLDAMECIDTHKNNLTFKITFTCTEGYYASPVAILVTPDRPSTEQTGSVTSSPVILDEGQSATLMLSIDLANGVPGQKYKANGYYRNAALNTNTLMEDAGSHTVKFTLGDYTGGIDAPEMSGKEQNAQYYDMTGRRVMAPARGGVYLRVTGSEVEKIIL